MKRSALLVLLAFAGTTLTYAATTAIPSISLASGTYTMPQNTTISDSTHGATIEWCYIAKGTCTPGTTYSGTIYIDPTTSEVICANATASGDSTSATVCNEYINKAATETSTPTISLASGTYPMPQNTTISDSTQGATILWCYVGTGTCTPSTTYSGTIYVDPTTTETLCANATASGDSTSQTVCNSWVNQASESKAATPDISLATGTYQMPQNTTISDATTGATIYWCYTGTGTCTPATQYTGTIYVDPASTETICAYATASGYQQSATVCNYYTNGSGSSISFSYSDGQVTISTSLQNATIFYTVDGSTATEASIEYTGPFAASAGTVINAVAVQMTSNGSQGVAVQNGEVTAANYKTVIAPTQTQAAPYVDNYNTPNIKYCGSTACGVVGIPTAIGFTPSLTLPSARGAGTTTNLTFTSESISGEGSGTQVLWPYNVGGGCDSCTSMVQDFYIWPEYTASVNPANVQNWELDMNSWDMSIPNNDGYLGASFQCSLVDGGWDYNGQHEPGWKVLYANSAKTQKLNHDCQLPFGTLNGSITNTATSFTVTPDSSGAATVEAGMIVLIDNEEIFCEAASGNTCSTAVRGWAGTTPEAHSSGARFSGSVHVQYHVTFKPGDTSVCTIDDTPTGTPVECVFIDYLILNNIKYDFHQIYGEITVGGVAGYSALHAPAYSIGSTYPDRVFNQKQLDVAPNVGSQQNPVQVGEYIDQDNVTASFGILASSSYTVPQ